ncbi:MAG TPA: glycosyltransferase family 4 protein [Solirubrobacterales bacterium]|nr:glycosyltransferase family 4 protein [Solirubrobacterales bacterium]
MSRAGGDGARVAIVFQGLKPAEKAFSGIPWGLGRGLRELGHEPVFVRAASPRPVERGQRALEERFTPARLLEPGHARLRSAFASRRLQRAGRIDAVVQCATGFLLPPHPRLATYEDMTVKQATAEDVAYGGMPRHVYEAWIARQQEAYARARACLTLSPWTSESIIRSYGVGPEKVHAIGAGRNIETSPVEREWWPPRYLFVGYDWGRKNGDGLLAAFRRLRDELPEAQLDLVGGHPPISEPGVTGHGLLSTDDPDQLRRLRGLFETATCFVMPSFIEPLGMVYQEAGAAGIPSIGTTVGGAPYAVGEGGVCVDPSDQAALLAAMRTYSDPESARQTGALAAAASEQTSWRAVAARACVALGIEPEAGA